MFKNTNTAAKVTIAVLLGLLILQSYTYHNKPPQVLEVEAKVCKADNVACVHAPELETMLGSSVPLYMCIEGAP